MSRLSTLQKALTAQFGDQVELESALGEITMTVSPDQWEATALQLRDTPELGFEVGIDLCGLDYLTYAVGKAGSDETGLNAVPGRYAVVLHLLSIKNNWRLRVRTFPTDQEFPVVASLQGVWPSLNWFEREAYDLFGIVFEDHPDLRRILTDYGFIGYPFRKDFPIYGYVEMRYDEEQGRVIYQPVTIEPREVVARVVREDGYGVGR